MKEKTLRRKAHKIGYSIVKGLRHYMYNWVVADPREVGFMVRDDRTGFYEWGCYNELYSHLWDIQDVEDFLKSEYERLGLQF